MSTFGCQDSIDTTSDNTDTSHATPVNIDISWDITGRSVRISIDGAPRLYGPNDATLYIDTTTARRIATALNDAADRTETRR